MTAHARRMLVRLAISGVLFLLFLAHTADWMQLRLLTTLENVAYDERVLLTMPGTRDPRIVIVDMDEKTLAARGWPLPRDVLGQLITQLFDHYRVRVVGFDMVFADVDRTSGIERLEQLAGGQMADLPGFAERVAALRESLDHDKAYADALRGKPVVLGYVLLPAGEAGAGEARGALGPVLLDKAARTESGVEFLTMGGYTGNLTVLQSAAPYGGFFDIATLDDDGQIRRVPLMERFGDVVYPSLALEVTRVALGHPAVTLEFDPPTARSALNLERVRIGDVTVPVDASISVMVPYRGRFGSFPYISLADVLEGKADAAALEGAIVLIGTTAPGLKDLRSTPVGQGYAGVEVHANIISGILDGRVNQKAPYYPGMETVMLLLIAGLLAWLFPRVSPGGAAAFTGCILAVILALGFGMWHEAHLVMPMGVPMVFTLAVFLTQLLYGYFIETRRARDTAKTFGQYVPKEIVEEIAASGQQISMEGKSKEMTVLFSDVRDFTTISEAFKDKPQELSELMNHFLTPLTQLIQKHRGTVDKYMGDAIMAFWGAPLDDPRHAQHALEAAIELPKAIRALDPIFEKRGWPKLKIGVGLSTGNMRVGNMGSEFRVAYTVMGDPVNLGSRIEALTKEYGAVVMCSEFTRGAGPSDWSFRELDQVRVKGKGQPVALYEPLGPKEALDPEVRQEVARHRGALKLYREQKWDAAEQEFFSLSRGKYPHKVYELFLERIVYYRKNPPGPTWDGVFTFKTK
ncbi:MAG TPA: adenylate/guanylate cyclase domain-containing protein [Candidatus Binatia bacterium]|nr:adenylate/guanylate cyclase domain-containing protein [Candidatus Binatia bacterium]